MEALQTQSDLQKVNWTSVIVYYVLACAISWPFFWWRDMHPDSWQGLHVPGFLKLWTYMWGPGISALICFFIFKRSHVRRITFFGSSLQKSLLFYFVPILALTIPGINGAEGMNPHLAPLMISVLGFISILGEELGWRGFLQDAVRPLPEVKRYILIGILWEAWHFTNRTSHGTLPQVLVRVGIFMLVTILLSLVIGRAADRTRSLVVAVTLHAWIDLLFEFGSMGTYVVFGLSILFWAYLLKTWKQETTLLQENK